jgi:CheY-like chemotaxis protein
MSHVLCCLVVEDHEFQRLMLVESLSSLRQTRIHQAANGAEAQKFLRDFGRDTDLVITDLTMPHLDGIELVPILRQFAPDAALILCSVDEVNLLTGEAIARGAGLRVLGAVAKPLTPAKLAPLLALLG